jgi:hypothetical protein
MTHWARALSSLPKLRYRKTMPVPLILMRIGKTRHREEEHHPKRGKGHHHPAG